MSVPNFFVSVDALNKLLETEFPEGLADVDLTLDLIELPYWLRLQSDETSQTMKVYDQIELYGKDENATFSRGELVFDRASGSAKVNAPEDLEKLMVAFFVACRNLGFWAQTEGVLPACEPLDPDEAGVLLTVEDDALRWRVVSGKERPELTLKQLFGGVTKGRPYMEDFWERSALDLMDEASLTEAAEGGDEDAMQTLAGAYLNGDADRAVEQDFEKSFYWWKKLAEAGNAVGMFNAGLHCAKGCGVARDFAKAAEWMDKAAAAGDEDAPAAAEAYRKIAFLAARADAGDAQAMAALSGELMKLGGSLEQAGPGADYEESLRWAQLAVAAGCAEGYWPLALAFEHGRGVDADAGKAVELYRRGAEGGVAACQHSYGCYLMRGDLVEPDPMRALELFELSAAQGYALAHRSLGYAYESGEYVEPDFEAELAHYEQACLADPSDAELLRHVAFQYLNLLDAEDEATWRRGVERAAHWFREAAKRGDALASRSADEWERVLALHDRGEVPAGASISDCMQAYAQSPED